MYIYTLPIYIFSQLNGRKAFPLSLLFSLKHLLLFPWLKTAHSSSKSLVPKTNCGPITFPFLEYPIHHQLGSSYFSLIKPKHFSMSLNVTILTQNTVTRSYTVCGRAKTLKKRERERNKVKKKIVSGLPRRSSS